MTRTQETKCDLLYKEHLLPGTPSPHFECRHDDLALLKRFVVYLRNFR